MKLLIILASLFLFPLDSYSGKCDYSWQLDSAGRKCGGRAASVRPGGQLGGDGHYEDSYGRQRTYGPGNDMYDNEQSKTQKKPWWLRWGD